MTTTSGAAAEWRKYWLVPLGAAMGYSAMGLQAYAVGPFVAPLEQEFGWSRAEVMLGLTISNLIGVFCNFAVGLMIDRLGPRRVGLTGLVVKCGAFALLATATGALLNWALLWVLVAFGAMLVQANIWTSAVASRFDKGRGFAIAVALTGSSVTAALAPLIATTLMADHGWRVAIAGTALSWLVVTFPLAFLFFRGKQDEVVRQSKEEAAAHAASLPGVTLKEGLRMPAFWRITAANFAFAFYTLSLSPNLIPLLGEKGLSVAAAAGIASLIGVVGLVARLSAGYLLDRFSANVVATCIFLMPVGGCALMLMDAPGYVLLAIAVASFGATIGAEYDVVFYLVSRHLGLKAFGALLGALLTAGAMAGAIAPVAAGWIHDTTGSYDTLLWILMGMMLLSALAMATMGKPKHDWGLPGH